MGRELPSGCTSAGRRAVSGVAGSSERGESHEAVGAVALRAMSLDALCAQA